MGATEMGTPFDKELDRAVTALVELRALRQQRRLSPSAFFDEACELGFGPQGARGEAARKQCEKIAELVRAANHCRSAQRFLRVCASECRKAEWSRVPRGSAFSMFLNVHGDEHVQSEAQQLGLSPMEIFAAGAHDATLHHASDFGAISNWEGHQRRTGELTKTYDAACAKLPLVVGGNDVDMDYDGVTNDERDRGLCQLRLRRHAPGFVLGRGWPATLCERLAVEREQADAEKAEHERKGFPRSVKSAGVPA